MQTKTKYVLFWSGTIRLFIEAYVDLCLAAVLNLRTIKWLEGLNFANSSNFQAFVAILACLFAPIALLVLFCKNSKNLRSRSFKLSYGSYVEGTRSETGNYYFAALLWPMTFFIRRLLLGLSLVYF